VFIVLILFGAGKLPQVGSAMGKGLRAFRRGQSGEEDTTEEEEVVEAKPRKTTKRKKAASKSG
jgi:sec-independent protein translocase protein TatA